MRINTNNAAFNVWTNYTQNVGGMQASMRRLSTGTISNTDDPAGVGISERMRAQIKGNEMAYSNANNSISMLSTACMAPENQRPDVQNEIPRHRIKWRNLGYR